MVEALNRHLEEDLECETLLECLYDLNELDRKCFDVLADSAEPLTVDQLADTVNRERSTVYRSVQRLFTTGFVKKAQRNYDEGGYYHVYSVVNTENISCDMYRTLNRWYTKMDQLIGDFAATYDGCDSDSSKH